MPLSEAAEARRFFREQQKLKNTKITKDLTMKDISRLLVQRPTYYNADENVFVRNPCYNPKYSGMICEPPKGDCVYVRHNKN